MELSHESNESSVLSNVKPSPSELRLPPLWPNHVGSLAIVFFLARWSGPSVVARNHLQDKAASAGLAVSELVVIDLDEHPAVYDVPELIGKIHAWGEAVVVQNGQVGSLHILGRNLERLDELIDRLLNEYSALRNLPSKPASNGDQPHDQ